MDTASRLVVIFIISGFVFVIGFFIFFFVMCCINFKKAYGHTILPGSAPLVVTSATHTVPAGYTVTQMAIGATTTAYQTQTYSPPYPTEGVPVHMPMPMPTVQPPAPGFVPNIASYPTIPAENMNPPSYETAVSAVGAEQLNNTLKQSTYSPKYAM